MIVVDTNAGENALFDGLIQAFGDATVRRERLDLGDVRLAVPGGLVLVERKTWPDFVSSLRDKRYSEQKLRLLAERERARDAGQRLDVVYLIEAGAVPRHSGSTAGMPNAQPFAALTKMSIRDGIFVVFSASAEDSARHVGYIYSTAVVGGFDAQAHMDSKVAASGYAGVCKFSNKRKNAMENPFVMMLATVDGCSGARDEAVARVYPTASALVRAFEASSAPDKLLADIEVGGRRLGPALSGRIRSAFA